MTSLQAGRGREATFADVVALARSAADKGEPGADRLLLISRHDIANIEHQLQFKDAREAKKRLREEEKKR